MLSKSLKGVAVSHFPKDQLMAFISIARVLGGKWEGSPHIVAGTGRLV